jgi:predicted GIY-YIG superfamily endonuclease
VEIDIEETVLKGAAVANPKDTVTYELKDGARIVYIGTSSNPGQRREQHIAAGKRFTRMAITSRKLTEKGAKKKEAERLATYRECHGGKPPKYNEDPDG